MYADYHRHEPLSDWNKRQISIQPPYKFKDSKKKGSKIYDLHQNGIHKIQLVEHCNSLWFASHLQNEPQGKPFSNSSFSLRSDRKDILNIQDT